MGNLIVSVWDAVACKSISTQRWHAVASTKRGLSTSTAHFGFVEEASSSASTQLASSQHGDSGPFRPLRLHRSAQSCGELALQGTGAIFCFVSSRQLSGAVIFRDKPQQHM